MRTINRENLKKAKVKSDSGFTLIEVLASLTILAIFSLGLVNLLGNMVIESTVAQQKDEAVAIARRFVNGFIDSGSDTSIPDQFTRYEDVNTPYTFHLNDTDLGAGGLVQSYTVNVTFPPPSSGITANYVEVTVTWQIANQGTVTPYSIHLEQASVS